METQSFVEDTNSCHPIGPSYVNHRARRFVCMACHDLGALCHTSAALIASCRLAYKINNFSMQSNQVSRISLRRSRLDLVGL